MEKILDRKYFRLFFVFYVFLNTLCLGYFGIQRNILYIPVFIWAAIILVYELCTKRLFYKQSHLGLIGLFAIILGLATYLNKEYSNFDSYLILGMQFVIFLLMFSNPKGTKLVSIKKEMRSIIPFTTVLTLVATGISLVMFFLNITTMRNGFTMGLVGDRLFGVYFNCNPAAFLGCIMIVLSMIALKAKYRFPLLYVANAGMQLMYIILSGCRTAVIVVAILAVAILYFKIFREHGFSRIKQVGVSFVVCIAVLFGSTLVQKVLYVIPQLQGAEELEDGNRFKLDKVMQIISLIQEGKSSNLRQIYNLSNEVTSGRVELLKTSMMVFKDNPIQGAGVNNFQRMGIALNPDDYVVKEPQVVHTHNVFMETLVVGGIFGFLVFFLFFLKSSAIIWETLKKYSASSSYFVVLCFLLVIVCDFIGGMLDYGVFYVYSLSSTLSWLFLGYIYWLNDHAVVSLTSDSTKYDFEKYQLLSVNYEKQEKDTLSGVSLKTVKKQCEENEYILDVAISISFTKSTSQFVYRSYFTLYDDKIVEEMEKEMAKEVYEMVNSELSDIISNNDDRIDLPRIE